MTEIHQAAAAGYTQAADPYVKGRPDYPSQLTDWLRNQLGLHPGTTVVDLGAGTGKFTPRLLETGARVIAVEPVVTMLSRLAGIWPRLETHVGSAEALPLPDASVNAILCAQSFHWFATRPALAELYRVLKPGGRLGLVWNRRDERVAWVRQLDLIVNQAEGDTPRYYTGDWRRVFPYPGFGPLQEQSFTNEHTGTPEDVILNRVRSTSFIAALAPEERAKIEHQVQTLLATDPALKGKNVVTVPYETAAFFTQKTG